MIKIVTYATHSQGMFDELVNNKFGIKIDVVGWGEQWRGYKGKLEKIYEYINNLQGDDIIIVVDGFDSKIIKPLDEIEKRFLEMNCKILCSIESEILKRVKLKVFTSCRNDQILNAGLYMGYVKYLKPILNDALKMNCKDDQRALNILCKKYQYIKIDTDEIIFSNKNNNNACILGFPGSPSINRIIIRGVKEYSQFFIFEYIILMFIIMTFFPKKNIFIFFFIFSLFLYIYIDKSCITF